MKILSWLRFRVVAEEGGLSPTEISRPVRRKAVAISLRRSTDIERLLAAKEHEAPGLWSENCEGFSRTALDGGNVKVLSKEKCQVLAERNGWSLERARGYVDGETSRQRAKKPSPYAVVGIDEYSLGFRAAYYERRNGVTKGVPQATQTDGRSVEQVEKSRRSRRGFDSPV